MKCSAHEIRVCDSRPVEVDNASVAAHVDWDVIPGEIRVVHHKVVTGKDDTAKVFAWGCSLSVCGLISKGRRKNDED